MEKIVASLIVMNTLFIGMLIVARSYTSSEGELLDSWREMRGRMEEMVETDLSPLSATTTDSGSTVEVTLKNEGDTKLADFKRWDVILHYYGSDDSYNVKWYPYGTGTNQWTVAGIYLDAANNVAEVYDPGILNPGEEAVIKVSVQPTVSSGTAVFFLAGTPNGISASISFTG